MKTVYDVGMHEGEDTEFYLRQGYRVVGVEANPGLIPRLRAKFSKEIANGTVAIVAKAIAKQAGTIKFAINDTTSVWGTADEHFADRNASLHSAPSTYVDVPAVPFEDVLRTYGVPHYLKLDVEGAEMLCLKALEGFPTRPDFLSVESRVTSPGFGFADVLEEIRTLKGLGYTSFQYVGQAGIPGRRHASPGADAEDAHVFSAHSSGPFGPDLDGTWRPFWTTAAIGLGLRLQEDLTGPSGRLQGKLAIRPVRVVRKALTGRVSDWFDLHASLAAPR